MGEVRSFPINEKIDLEHLGKLLEDFLIQKKNMTIQDRSYKSNIYSIRIIDRNHKWKKIAGLTKALQIQLESRDNNLIINCDSGKWADKIIAGGIGAAVFPLLSLTAIVGAVSQYMLPNEIFSAIEKIISLNKNDTQVINETEKNIINYDNIQKKENEIEDYTQSILDSNYFYQLSAINQQKLISNQIGKGADAILSFLTNNKINKQWNENLSDLKCADLIINEALSILKLKAIKYNKEYIKKFGDDIITAKIIGGYFITTSMLAAIAFNDDEHNAELTNELTLTLTPIMSYLIENYIEFKKDEDVKEAVENYIISLKLKINTTYNIFKVSDSETLISKVAVGCLDNLEVDEKEDLRSEISEFIYESTKKVIKYLDKYIIRR